MKMTKITLEKDGKPQEYEGKAVIAIVIDPKGLEEQGGCYALALGTGDLAEILWKAAGGFGRMASRLGETEDPFLRTIEVECLAKHFKESAMGTDSDMVVKNESYETEEADEED